MTKSSRSIGAEISPVNAPLSSGCMFCAPSFTTVPSSTRLTPSRAVNGGQTTTSTSFRLPTIPTMSRTRAAASAVVLFIFQLPTISF